MKFQMDWNKSKVDRHKRYLKQPNLRTLWTLWPVNVARLITNSTISQIGVLIGLKIYEGEKKIVLDRLDK